MVAVLLVLTSWDKLGDTGKKTGWYLPEAAHPYNIFKDAGFQITVCSPKGGKAPLDPGSLDAFKDDEMCKRFLNDQEAQNKVNNTVPIHDIDPKDFQIVFFAGGHGPMFDLADNERMNSISAKVYENGGILGAVCHGVVGLLNVKLANGVDLVSTLQLTCFTNEEEAAMNLTDAVPFLLETELVKKGAAMQKAPNFHSLTVLLRRVITGQNPASSEGVANAIVRKAEELKL